MRNFHRDYAALVTTDEYAFRVNLFLDSEGNPLTRQLDEVFTTRSVAIGTLRVAFSHHYIEYFCCFYLILLDMNICHENLIHHVGLSALAYVQCAHSAY